ncbi:hypothetical protein [Legionella hackeliae]|uniref:Uncharacterized protein n=1 Tax=Legionella hackeliae TaxID=449 RepID=A0A0A8UK71_LEGHA|nr:hypothetical protein [Legionella hackeliae]KTD12949.1 hypothetical protein Lhac_1820 [Legionella hackeliae]CEK09260.1 conserved protein of unknown function [Legionella hackeliae]STX49167.1 Uncharacterised protein [Legionella hackeliae]
MVEIFVKKITTYIQKLQDIFNKYRVEKGYRYSLINVTTQNNAIELHVIVLGIKKHILKLRPEEVIYDDGLLSEFSPCDVRAITYLSFQKYVKQELYSLKIEQQHINNGETLFGLKDVNTDRVFNIDAKNLYQNYDLLIKLSRKDMINVISTAVQEQTILDIKNMERLRDQL